MALISDRQGTIGCGCMILAAGMAFCFICIGIGGCTAFQNGDIKIGHDSQVEAPIVPATR
jgi:hypothetical protein